MKFTRLIVLVLLLISIVGCYSNSNDESTDDQNKEQTEHEKNGSSDEIQDEPTENQEKDSIEPEEPVESEKPEDVAPGDIGLVIENGQISLSSKFFNELAIVDDVTTIQNPDNLLVMANKTFYLPSDYSPNDLVQPEVPFVFEGADQNYMRQVAAEALEKMFADALDQDIHLIARSGYRSYNIQAIVFQRNVDQMGYEEASLISAKPGTSEHQTGLTMDITANSVSQQLTQDFGETKEGIWLKDNAHKYGFIMRYPEGKEDITKYSYEPWHFRYVGLEAAKVIFENNWTLEEFFDTVREI